jgi:hypothetical protein
MMKKHHSLEKLGVMAIFSEQIHDLTIECVHLSRNLKRHQHSMYIVVRPQLSFATVNKSRKWKK